MASSSWAVTQPEAGGKMMFEPYRSKSIYYSIFMQSAKFQPISAKNSLLEISIYLGKGLNWENGECLSSAWLPTLSFIGQRLIE